MIEGFDSVVGLLKENKMQKIKLYLHIGIHKTGTTAIQNFLYVNKESLKDNWIYIPSKHLSDNRPQELLFKILDNNLEYLEILQSMKQECIENNCHTIVLSNEDMTKMRDIDVVKQLNDMFDLKIVVYLRRQDKYIESNYSFFATLFETRYEYKKPIYEVPAMGNITTYYCDLIDFWSSGMSKSNILIKRYDQAVKNNNLLGSFLEILGLDLDERFNTIETTKNVSPNKYVVQFMLGIDNSLNDRETYNNIFNWLKTESIIKNGPKAIFFSKKDRIELMNKCNGCNQRLSSEFLEGKSIFNDDYDIQVPESISPEIINRLVQDIKSKFNIDIKIRENYSCDH